MAVVAATGRALAPLVAAATAAGWRVRPLALDGAEIITVAGALADPSVTAVLAGSGEPPGGDERPLIADLVTIVAAAAQRRPDLDTVLVGRPGGARRAHGGGDARPTAPGATMTAPSPSAGGGEALRELLDELRGPGPDGRRALAASTATLAEVLGRRVEVIEIGQSAGARAAASPPRADADTRRPSAAPPRSRSSPRPRSCRAASATRTSTRSSAG